LPLHLSPSLARQFSSLSSPPSIDGIDADKDGVRDDVQRFIFEQWPESERARRVLYEIAKIGLMQVHHGGDLGKEETRKLAPQIMRASICYMGNTQSPALINQSAAERVRAKVTNTPERWLRAAEFDQHLAHNVYELPNETPTEACGFDLAALPNWKEATSQRLTSLFIARGSKRGHGALYSSM